MQVGGTATAPTLRGIARLADGRFGDFHAPLVQGVVNYARTAGSTRISISGAPGRTSCRSRLTFRSTSPLRGAKQRRLDGPLSVRAHTDSVDLGLLEALTPAVTQVHGTLAADVQVEGTWAAPRLAGKVDVKGGSMSVPGLGVRFGTVKGGAVSAGRFRGPARRAGHERRRSPRDHRRAPARRPLAPGAGPRSPGRPVPRHRRAQLSHPGGHRQPPAPGPVFGATLTGNLAANSGVLYFADLVNKRIIDLEDPAYADLVDTTLIRRENLGAKFQNRFLDSLRINDLRLSMGSRCLAPVGRSEHPARRQRPGEQDGAGLQLRPARSTPRAAATRSRSARSRATSPSSEGAGAATSGT